MSRRTLRVVSAAALLCLLAARAESQSFRVQQYGLADGLPNASITAVYQDRFGFLWVGTVEGLARFDGFGFRHYSTSDGLGHDYITAIGEDRRGRLWIGTYGGGLAWLREDGGTPAFASVPVADVLHANAINAIGFAADNTMWVGTDAGMFRAPDAGDAPRTFTSVTGTPSGDTFSTVVDGAGRVWAAWRRLGLFRLDGGPAARQIAGVPPTRSIEIFEKGDGALYIATDDGPFLLREIEPGTDRWIAERIAGLTVPTFGIVQDAQQALWMATSQGVIRLRDGTQLDSKSTQGLPADPNRAMLLDRDGNLWLGTRGSGVYRVRPTALTTVNWSDGPDMGGAVGSFAGVDGRLYIRLLDGNVAAVRDGAGTRIGHLGNEAFARGRRVFVSRAGDWWWLQRRQLCRQRGPAFDPNSPIECVPIPAPHDDFVTRSADTMDLPDIHEEQPGLFWFGTRNGLWQYDSRQPGAVSHRITGLPEALHTLAPGFRDRGGNLWLFTSELVVRLRPDGNVEQLPVRQPRSALIDRKGRLWIGTRYQGVSMAEAPDAASVAFTSMTTHDGLSSNAVYSIAEDQSGRLYFGTGRGLVRFDPDERRLEHFSSRDGLAGDVVHHCLAMNDGSIWIATASGVSRFDPAAEAASAAPPPTYFQRIDVAGEPQPVPAAGAREVSGLRLATNRSSLLIEFVSPALRSEHRLRYEYRLGSDNRDWTPAENGRSVHLAGLSPGDYDFQVRARHVDTDVAGPAASLSFYVQPPVWRRPWFLALAVMAALSALFVAYRVRINRLLATERLRQQIATDLHDDVGAGLTQVAILSEVARRQPATVDHHLGEIASLARAMRDSMSDIVWAIDPRSDRAADLVRRMRQVAMNALAADGIRVDFHAPDEGAVDRLSLPPDCRRHLLLMLKEAITNIARHARASRVTIDVTLSHGAIDVRVEDNGVGVDLIQETEGQGLRNLRRRSERLRAELTIDSAPGRGTRVELRLPIR